MLIIKSVWGAWGRKFESCHPDLLKALNFLRSSVLFGYFRPRCLCFSHTDRFFNAKKNAMHCIGEDKALHMPIQCFAWGNGQHCIKIPTMTNCRYTCHPHKSSRASHPTSESPPHRLGKQWKTWATIKYELTMYAFGYYLNVRVLTSHTRSPTIRNNSSATSAKHIYKLLWRKKLIVTP